MPTAHRYPGVRIYDRPGPLAHIWRGHSRVVVSMLVLIMSLLTAYLLYWRP
jgi:hypothetical protein